MMPRTTTQGKLMPRMWEAFREERTDRAILNELGELGFLGVTLQGYGCPGGMHLHYGLIARELDRVDSAYRSAFFAPSSLVMYPIHSYANEALTTKHLPKLATGELAGCFGLTEPDHGSDLGGMRNRARQIQSVGPYPPARPALPIRRSAPSHIDWEMSVRLTAVSRLISREE